jgi:hypothetical protein
MPYIPTPSSGGRNRYAEIMSQFGQSQPFSFFGMPSGGFNPYASDYTGGFTPYQRTFTPQPIVNPVEPTVPMVGAGGGGGGGYSSSLEGRAEREAPMSESDRAFQRSVNEAIAFGIDNIGKISPVVTGVKALFGPTTTAETPDESTGGPSRMQSLLAASREEKAMQDAIAEANIQGAGLVANPMSLDPSQRVVSTPVVTAPIVEVPAITEGLLSTPIVETPVVAPAPVVTAPIVETPAPAPAPVAPTAMRTVVERWNNEESPPAGQGWQAKALGKGEVGYTRTVNVPVGFSGALADAAQDERIAAFDAMRSGFDRNMVTPGGGSRDAAPAPAASRGFGREGQHAGLYKGGPVSMQHLNGPNPDGPDDGYVALKMGEYVINDKAVKKYGIELMEAINSGKISKGKLRGLLEM